jgi:hypothetical protein
VIYAEGDLVFGIWYLARRTAGGEGVFFHCFFAGEGYNLPQYEKQGDITK